MAKNEYDGENENSKYGRLTLQIDLLRMENNISKTQMCKDLNISHTNLNRYCKNEIQRIDTNLLCKLLTYFNCTPNDLIKHEKNE